MGNFFAGTTETDTRDGSWDVPEVPTSMAHVTTMGDIGSRQDPIVPTTQASVRVEAQRPDDDNMHPDTLPFSFRTEIERNQIDNNHDEPMIQDNTDQHQDPSNTNEIHARLVALTDKALSDDNITVNDLMYILNNRAHLNTMAELDLITPEGAAAVERIFASFMSSLTSNGTDLRGLHDNHGLTPPRVPTPLPLTEERSALATNAAAPMNLMDVPPLIDLTPSRSTTARSTNVLSLNAARNGTLPQTNGSRVDLRSRLSTGATTTRTAHTGQHANVRTAGAAGPRSTARSTSVRPTPSSTLRDSRVRAQPHARLSPSACMTAAHGAQRMASSSTALPLPVPSMNYAGVPAQTDLVAAPQPLFYVDPLPPHGAAQLPMQLYDTLALKPWTEVHHRVWPLTDLAGTALGKQVKNMPTLVSGMLRTLAKDPTQYITQRTSLIETFSRSYINAVYLQHGDGTVVCTSEFIIQGGLQSADDTLDTALALAPEASSASSQLTRIITLLNTRGRNFESRVYVFVEECDRAFIFSNMRMTERLKVKEVTPNAVETPLQFLDRIEALALTRNLSDQDVCDMIHRVLKERAVDLLRNGSAVDWESTDAIRDYLRKHVDSESTFAEFAKRVAKPRAAPSGGADTLVAEGEEEMHVLQTRNENTSVDGWVLPSQLETTMERMTQAMNRLAMPAPGAPPPLAPPTQTHTNAINKLTAAIARLEQRASEAQHTPSGETLVTAGPRPKLDLERIYPVLFPSAAVPVKDKLVGGKGWTGDTPPCAACLVHKPMVTNWITYQEHMELAKDNPALIDATTGRPKLPPGQAFVHNPARCATLHKLVREHVQKNPSDAWMVLDAIA